MHVFLFLNISIFDEKLMNLHIKHVHTSTKLISFIFATSQQHMRTYCKILTNPLKCYYLKENSNGARHIHYNGSIVKINA